MGLVTGFIEKLKYVQGVCFVRVDQSSLLIMNGCRLSSGSGSSATTCGEPAAGGSQPTNRASTS
eukprot:8619422-Pyramimonas_sp.AAC.1